MHIYVIDIHISLRNEKGEGLWVQRNKADDGKWLSTDQCSIPRTLPQQQRYCAVSLFPQMMVLPQQYTCPSVFSHEEMLILKNVSFSPSHASVYFKTSTVKPLSLFQLSLVKSVSFKQRTNTVFI